MNSEQIGDMQADAEGARSRWPAEIEAPGATGAVSRPDIQARMGEIQKQLEQVGKDIGEPRIIIPPIFLDVPIAGIEYTQATQFFRFNGKGSGNAPNNTVPLVAQKALILRVYVSPQSVFWNHPVATVSGKVTYSGHPDLAPLNGPLEAGRSDTSGQIDRLPAMAAELIGRPAI